MLLAPLPPQLYLGIVAVVGGDWPISMGGFVIVAVAAGGGRSARAVVGGVPRMGWVVSMDGLVGPAQGAGLSICSVPVNGVRLSTLVIGSVPSMRCVSVGWGEPPLGAGINLSAAGCFAAHDRNWDARLGVIFGAFRPRPNS